MREDTCHFPEARVAVQERAEQKGAEILMGLACTALWLLVSERPFVKRVPERFMAAAK